MQSTRTSQTIKLQNRNVRSGESLRKTKAEFRRREQIRKTMEHTLKNRLLGCSERNCGFFKRKGIHFYLNLESTLINYIFSILFDNL